MTKEDWVILRLLKLFAKEPHISGKTEYIKAVNFLIKKYGTEVIDFSIDQLHAEKTHDQDNRLATTSSPR